MASGKRKNPKRVAAGKKAARARKRGGGARRRARRAYSYVRGGRSRKKLISVSKGTAVVGGVVMITGLGAAQSAVFVGALNDFLAGFGLGPVNGVTIVAALIGLAMLASASVWFGAKYRGFLKTWGLKP